MGSKCAVIAAISSTVATAIQWHTKAQRALVLAASFQVMHSSFSRYTLMNTAGPFKCVFSARRDTQTNHNEDSQSQGGRAHPGTAVGRPVFNAAHVALYARYLRFPGDALTRDTFNAIQLEFQNVCKLN